MKVHNVEQGSDQWKKLRLGIPTASEFHRIITPKTMKMSAQADLYACVLIAERIIGEPLDSGASKFMDRGIEMQEEAVRWYEMERDIDTEVVGFITSDDGTVGCSPDRLIPSVIFPNGGLEVKCPSAGVHVQNFFGMKADYNLQVQGCMWLTGRDWWDVVSYNPAMAPILIQTLRDDKCIELIAKALDQFKDMLERKFERFIEQYIDDSIDMLVEWKKKSVA